MFFDLTRGKLLWASTLVTLICVSVIGFTYANELWSIIPQAAYDIARQESGLWYWLAYKLPNSASVGVASSTPAEGYARSIPVLLYHGESGGADMPTSVFVDQMRALKAAGWQTITMSEFDEWMKGEIQLPDKSFLLTFDDGRTDTYYPVDPVLQDLNYHAVMFVITGFSLPPSGKPIPFYLNETDLKNMAASGRWDIESHGDLDHALYAVQSTTDLSQAASTTQGHYMSNKFWDATTNAFETDAEFTTRVTGDLEQSQQTLESDFGAPVIGYAYPFNDYGDQSVNFPGAEAILDKAVPSVYTYSFYQTWTQNGDTFNYPGVNNGPGTTAYMIKRFEPQSSWSGQDLLDYLQAGEAKPLPYTTTSFGSEWVGAWGDVSATTQGLALSASTSTSGADAFLNGSGWWKDYYYAATINWQRGSSISLTARNDDDTDYLACAFTQTEAVLELHERGTNVIIARVSHTFLGSDANAQVGIGVQGNQATCYESGIAVVSGYAASAPSQGGIGVEIWDSGLGYAKSTLESVSISMQPPAQPTALSTTVLATSPVAQSALVSAPVAPAPAPPVSSSVDPPSSIATSTRKTFSPFTNFFRMRSRSSGAQR